MNVGEELRLVELLCPQSRTGRSTEAELKSPAISCPHTSQYLSKFLGDHT